MGRPMAGHLVRAGHSLTVFDIDAAAAAYLGEHPTVHIAKGPEDFRTTDTLVTMLPTGAIVRDVLLGPHGIAAKLPRGALIIDMSSSEPEGTRETGRNAGTLRLFTGGCTSVGRGAPRDGCRTVRS